MTTKRANLIFSHQYKELGISPTDYHTKPEYPEPEDTIISLDSNGAPLSKFNDDVWDFSNVVGGCKLMWIGGVNISISKANLHLAKSALLYTIYDKRVSRSKIGSLKRFKSILVRLGKVADENNISLSNISRYPKLDEAIANCFAKTQWDTYVNLLSKLNDVGKDVGFTILDKKMLTRVVSILTLRPKFVVNQFPVIPPRIWSYQISRLNECLDDYLKIKPKLEALVIKVMGAYEFNQKFLKKHETMRGSSSPLKNPNSYTNPFTALTTLKGLKGFTTSFESMARSEGILEVVEKYHKPTSRYSIYYLRSWLYFFQQAAMQYIQFFSMQRQGEVLSLFTDCLEVETDPRLGKIYILKGETTKTMQDSDARWIVPKQVLKALDVSIAIARLLQKYTPSNFESKSSEHPLWLSAYFFHRSDEQIKRSKVIGSQKFNNLFESEKMTITEADYRFACALTPTLNSNDEFEVGKIWPFSSHQCRRTLIVYMMSSGLVEDSSMQYLAKHISVYMTQYYARNYTSIILNEAVEKDLIVESYLAKARVINQVLEEKISVVKPHLRQPYRDVDQSQTAKLVKANEIGLRPTLLGFCAKAGFCEYGGVESVTKCTGADGGGICSEAIFAVENNLKLCKLKIKFQNEINSLPADSCRAKALTYEIKAIEIYERSIKGE